MSKRLSVAAIERLKPDPVKRLEIPDAAKPGLYLVLQPQAEPAGKRKMSWAVRYRHNGKPRKLTLPGFPSLASARKLAQAALDKVANGGDPAKEKKAARNAPNNRIEDVFADFLAKHIRKRNGEPIRETSRRETGRIFGLKPAEDNLSSWTPQVPKRGVLAHWAGRDVQDITKRDVLGLLDKIVAGGAPIGANRTLSALKTFFTWCVKRDILTVSPADHVDDPSPEKSAERDLSDAELAAIWRAAEGMGYPYGRMVQLLMLTGQRRDEVREAVRSEFDLSTSMWKLPGERTKNGREHHVPLSGAATALLEGLPKIKSAHGWLFTIKGKVPVSNLAKRKRRLRETMLLELRKANPEAPEPARWRLHDLRHTLKTWMQRTRVPKDVRNAVQNHYDGDMDELYGHYTFETEKREALEGWARHIERLVSGEAVAQVVPMLGKRQRA